MSVFAGNEEERERLVVVTLSLLGGGGDLSQLIKSPKQDRTRRALTL